MTHDAEFTFMAHRFNEEMGIVIDEPGYDLDVQAQHTVCKEEWDEYIEAWNSGELDKVAEEMADVLVTLFVQAERMGIDIAGAYQEKMLYNLQKSGERNEDGKVVDDSEVEKPDFSQFTEGYVY